MIAVGHGRIVTLLERLGEMSAITRRDFLGRIESAAAAGVLGLTGSAAAQTPGERPIQAADVVVLNPATRSRSASSSTTRPAS